MRLLLFTTDKDRSLSSLLEAATKYSLKTKVIFYSDLSFHQGKIMVQNEPLRVTGNDKIFIRWPWNPLDTRREYTFYAKYLVDTFPEQIILDNVCLSDFSPFYEDKLFQALMFAKLGIRTPQTWNFSKLTDVAAQSLPFPVVMKKRISSRGKKVYQISSYQELLRRTRNVQISTLIFQEYIPFHQDLRVLIYKNEYIGTVERVPHRRTNNRLTVKGGSRYPLKNNALIKDCLLYTNYIGADLVGFDVLIGEDRKSYIIEANLSPQYNKFEERTGISVSERIIKDIL